MHIAIFTDSFHPELGGIQDSVLLTSRALGERGHQVVVYAPQASPQDYRIAGVPMAEVQVGPNVQVRRLFAVSAPGSTGQSRLVAPTGLRWRELRPFRPDIIHTHTFLAAGWEAVWAARRLRVPIVGTNHWAVREFSSYIPLPGAFFGRASLKAVTWYYNRCSMVTGPSRSVIEEMRGFGLSRPHEVVSNPIDTQLFSPATPERRRALKRQLGFSDATVLYAGRLATEKRVDVLVLAFAQVLQDVPSAMLALAGHGSDQRRLAALANRIGVGDRVKFLGTLPQPALADAFRAADVFAIASTSETQSMVLLQAMSSGLPGVAARWRALPECIDAGSGLLAEPGDHDQFAAQLTTLLLDPALRARMAMRAAQRARSVAVAAVVATWEDLYARMTSAETRPSLNDGGSP